MLKWLRNLNRPPANEIHIDEQHVSVARPGDTVVFSVERRMTAEQRQSLRDMIKGMEARFPGVRFMCIESVTGVVVVPASGSERIAVPTEHRNMGAQNASPRCAMLVAPQGSGKTQMAPALMAALGLNTLVDEFDHATWPEVLPDNALVVSSHMPAGVPAHVRIVSLEEARALIPPGKAAA